MTLLAPNPEPQTVGDVRENLRFLLAAQQGEVHERANAWRRQRLAELEPYVPDFRLVTIQEIAYGSQNRLTLYPAQVEACVWQQRRNLALGSYQQSLWDTITAADDDGLDRLALAYPAKVEAVRQWRNNSEFARRLRAMPFAFSL